MMPNALKRTIVLNNDQTCVQLLPRVGILILNQNGKELVGPLHESLRRDEYSNIRIYLVDNDSDDGSVELTLERYPEVAIIRMPKNLGYCMVYNLAMPRAFADGCQWIIWSNNDIRLQSGCLSELARVARSDSRIGGLGPAFLAWESDEPNYYIFGNPPHSATALKALF
jgi:GT2 family glycosyltransferase